MKKTITLVALLLTLVSGAFAAAWTGSTSEPESTRKIDGKSFYVITTADELAWFAAQVNGGKTTINAVLDNDIVFGSSTTTASSSVWTPIGKDSTHVFNGILDGGNHTISGLYVVGLEFAGIIGVLGNNGIVKNLTLKNGVFSGKKYSAGISAVNNGLVSFCQNYNNESMSSYESIIISGGCSAINRGTIDNCKNGYEVLGEKKRTTEKYYTGGIAGKNFGTIRNSSNIQRRSHDMRGGEYGTANFYREFFEGGLVGYNEGEVSYSLNAGVITVVFTDYKELHYKKAYVGGGVGYNKGTVQYVSNTDSLVCHYGGEYRGDQEDVIVIGGVVGFNEKNVLNSFNTGYIYAWNYGVVSHHLGGVVGVNSGTSALIKNTYNAGKGKVTDFFGPGGVVGLNKQNAVVMNSYFDQTILSVYTQSYPQKELNLSAIYNQSATATNVSGKTTTDMKKDQFAWILNTTNGTTANSKVWSRTDGYPIFATSTYKPIVKVVFDDDGSTTNRYSNNKALVSFPSDPTPETGYVFVGWYNGTTRVTPSTEFSNDVRATAKYLDAASVFYTIKFYNDDKKTLLDSQSVGYGKTPVYSGTTPTKAATAQYTYSFSNWDRTIVAAYSDTSYYAVYTSKVNSYAITFNDYNGTELQRSSVNYGTTPVYSKTPTRASTAEWTYTFKGWNPAIASVTGAATYTAVYDSSKVQYAITFNDYDGTKLKSVDVDYGSIPSYGESPTRTGDAQWAYAFKTWSPALAIVTGPASYKAVYDSSLAKYRVVFKNCDGSEILLEMLEYGTTPTPPSSSTCNPTAEWSYSFAGWNDAIVPVVGPAEYVALYDSTKNSYAVSFVNYEGSEIQKTILKYGELPVCSKTPVRESTTEWRYEFKGWNPEVSNVTGETEYRAVYDSIKAEYAVSLWSDGSLVQMSNVAYGESFVIPRGVAKEGYTFMGWYVGENILGYVGDVITITQDVDAEAKYIINSYKVKFVDIDGTILKEEYYEYGDMPVYGSLVVRENTPDWNYEFIGWKPTIGKVTKETVYSALYDSTRVTYGNSSVIDDVEDGDNQTKSGGSWFVFNDANDGGASTFTNMKNELDYVVVFDGTNGTDYMVGMEGVSLDQGASKNNPYVALGMNITGENAANNLSTCSEISYDYIGADHNFAVVMAGDEVGTLTGYNRHFKMVPASTTWTTATINWSDLLQALGWGTTLALDESRISSFQWEIHGDKEGTQPYPNYLYVDNVTCNGLDVAALASSSSNQPYVPTSSNSYNPVSSSSYNPHLAVGVVQSRGGLKVSMSGSTLNVTVERAGLVKVNVFDMMGHVIESHVENQAVGTYGHSLANLSKGAYIVRVQQGSEQKVICIQVR